MLKSQIICQYGSSKDENGQRVNVLNVRVYIIVFLKKLAFHYIIICDVYCMYDLLL